MQPRAFAGPALLFVVLAPLAAHFAWQDGIATLSDDSVSYLVLARWLAGSAGPLLAPWVGYQSNFPPLFPLVLAAVGGAANLLVAHLAVAAFTVAAALAVRRYAALRLGSEGAGLAVAAAFVVAPTFWVSMKGILSEPMFLLATLAVLHLHARRWETPEKVSWTSAAALGAAMAVALLTRTAGVALLAAFVLHSAIRAFARRGSRVLPLAVLAIPLVLQLAWLALRPSAGADRYAGTAVEVLAYWRGGPLEVLQVAMRYLLDGWVASFTATPEVPLAMRVAFLALGAVGLAGSVRAALANRLDGWYVLGTLAMVLAWVFPEENMRRLLYPVLPLILVHAVEAVRAIAQGRLTSVRAAAVTVVVPVLLGAPAFVLVQEKSFDAAPAKGAQGYADITDYYRIANRQQASAAAAKQLAVIEGFESLASRTAPDARVMWMRPEYVALLGARAGEPFYYDWDAHRLAAEVRASRVDYVVVAHLYKTDLEGRAGDPFKTLATLSDYATAVYSVANAQNGGEEFALMRIDPARLEAYLASDSHAVK